MGVIVFISIIKETSQKSELALFLLMTRLYRYYQWPCCLCINAWHMSDEIFFVMIAWYQRSFKNAQCFIHLRYQWWRRPCHLSFKIFFKGFKQTKRDSVFFFCFVFVFVLFLYCYSICKRNYLCIKGQQIKGNSGGKLIIIIILKQYKEKSKTNLKTQMAYSNFFLTWVMIPFVIFMLLNVFLYSCTNKSVLLFKHVFI